MHHYSAPQIACTNIVQCCILETVLYLCNIPDYVSQVTGFPYKQSIDKARLTIRLTVSTLTKKESKNMDAYTLDLLRILGAALIVVLMAVKG